MDDLIQLELLVLELLAIVSAVAILVRRFRIPYTVALVLAGLGLSFRSALGVELTPELILSLFIPPLVFEAAIHLNINQLRQNLVTIGLLAIPGVILTMLIVGGIVAFGVGLSVGSALVFGALIAATDPVSVVAIFRKMGAPKRLEILLESESLFNDGTAIVVFNLAVASLLGGTFRLGEGVLDFIRVAGGGLFVGLALGWLATRLFVLVDDHLVETTLTTVLAFGTYLIAEQMFHVSGVLAVVMAGLLNGNFGPRGMSPTTRIVVLNFWEYVAFLANSAVFLLIGLEINLGGLLNNWQPILWAIVSVLIARFAGIYGLSRLGQSMPSRWRHVLFWGGLRGAIALALALSLPTSMGEDRLLIIEMAFGVVLFTLLVQGLSMDWLIKRLGLIAHSEDQMRYERRHARALAARASYDHLEDLHSEGLISSHTWQALEPALKRRTEALRSAVQDVLRQAPQLEVEEMTAARRETLRAQRSMFANLRRDGVISDETYGDLVAEVDMALEVGVDQWAQMVLARANALEIQHLILAVIQDQDLEAVTNAMALRGVPTTHIESRGGFLGRRNHLLLVGIPQGEISEVVSALQKATRDRVVFPEEMEGGLADLHAHGRSIRVSGATVFAFELSRYEEV